MNGVKETANLTEYRVLKEERKNEKIEEEKANEASKARGKESPQLNLRSILKKSKEERKRLRQEEERKLELQKKAEEIKKHEEMLANLIPAEVSEELKQSVLAALKNSNNSSNIVENVKILLGAEKMQNQQQGLHNSELNGPFFGDRRQQDFLNGDQVQKRVKMNPETYNPLQLSQIWPPQLLQFPNMPLNVPLMNQSFQMQPGHIAEDGHPPNSGGKKPYKPQNYKTVPCKLFHSSQGCQYGDGCHYIHDHNFAGRQTPAMQKFARSHNSPKKASGKIPTLQRVDQNEMSTESDKNSSLPKTIINVPCPSNNTSGIVQEGADINPNARPLPNHFNPSPNFPLQQPQFPGSYPPNPHFCQPQPLFNVPPEGRINYHTPNPMSNGKFNPQQINNRAYQAQGPPFSQPIQALPGPPLQQPQYQQQFHLNKPLIQHPGPHPFQSPPLHPNRGPPLPLPNHFSGLPDPRSFHNAPNGTYQRMQAPGPIPFPSNYQFKHPNPGHGPSEGTFHNLACKNNVNSIHEKKNQEYKFK